MRALVLTAALAATPAMAQEGTAEQPLSVLQPIEGDGFLHLQSGLRCPSDVGGAERVAAKALNPFGLDVSCGYKTSEVVVTLYVTYGLPLEESFGIAKEAIVSNPAFGPLQQVSDGPVTQGGMAWLKAEYQTNTGRRTALWISERHGWLVKYRVTYLPGAGRAADDLLTALTAIVQESAGGHLDLCAKAPVPPRPGKALKHRAGESDPATLAALLGQAVARVGAAGAEARPLAYCMDEWLGDGNRGFMLWRGVTPDGEDARTDRLTAMTLGRPPALDTSPDEIGALVGGRRASPRWAATTSDGKVTAFYGFYDGRPSAKALAPLARDLLDGKAQPVGSVSTDGQDVNLTLPSR